MTRLAGRTGSTGSWGSRTDNFSWPWRIQGGIHRIPQELRQTRHRPSTCHQPSAIRHKLNLFRRDFISSSTDTLKIYEKDSDPVSIVFLTLGSSALSGLGRDNGRIELFAHSVIPHIQSAEMQYRRPADFNLGARVQIFVKNTGREPLDLNRDDLIEVNGKSPAHWMASGHWTWHDLPGSEHTKDFYETLLPEQEHSGHSTPPIMTGCHLTPARQSPSGQDTKNTISA